MAGRVGKRKGGENNRGGKREREKEGGSEGELGGREVRDMLYR